MANKNKDKIKKEKKPLFKKKDKKSKPEKQKRPLTKKEKLMLIVFLVGTIGYLGYTFVYTPQIEDIASLTTQKTEKRAQVDNIQKILGDEFTIDKKIEEIVEKKEEVLSRYFTEIYQPQLIKIVSELMKAEGFELEEVNFDNRATEKINKETSIYSLRMLSSFHGNYEGIKRVIDNINNNYKHIGIYGMKLTKDDKIPNLLNGKLDLQVLSTTGLVETENTEHADISDIIPLDGVKPFQEIPGYSTKDTPGVGEDGVLYDENGNPIGTDGKPIIEEEKDTRLFTLLHNFEDDTTKFFSTSKLSKGRISKSTNAKIGKHSLKLDYNIIAVEKINRVYADITEKNIVLKYPSEALGMWVHSYGYSPGTLGLRLAGQAGEIIDLDVSKGIGFMGWKYIETTPPEDIGIYPLQIEKIYFELPQDREDYGVLLVDQLESIMPSPDVDKDGKPQEVKSYGFYKTGDEDTLRTSVTNYYGNTKYLKEVGNINDITNYDILLAPETIVIMPKH